MTDLEFHPIADIFPLMDGHEFEAFTDDIRDHGLREPIMLWDGRILDGRNRFRACRKARIEPTFVEASFEADEALSFVLSHNLHRRHLSESQRAMIGARMANLTPGRPTTGSRDHVSVDEAADAVGVGRATVVRGKKVLKDGAKILVNAVSTGDLTVAVAAKIADLRKKDQIEVVRSDRPDLALKQRRRASRREELAGASEQAAENLGERLYPVIVADPPWHFDTYSEAGRDRTADNHYPLMSLDEIAAMEVPALDDCLLFLWATPPHLSRQIQILEPWGFRYVSNFVWNKTGKIGMGHYGRFKHEHLLIGRRGTKIGEPDENAREDSVLDAPYRGPSVKPFEMYERIVRMYPDVPRLEMFARGDGNDGFVAWGNEVTDGSS